MIYKCKNCGSALRFDTETGKLKCDYCSSMFEPAEYDETLGKNDVPYETMEQKIYTCSACGAKLMINDVEAASFCAFCGQPTIVFDRVSKIRKPDIVLPFAITKEAAHEAIVKKTKGFFVPKEIKDVKPDVVRGIYIPYSYTDLDYHGKQVISGEVNSGKTSTTRYFYRECKAKFEALPVDLSVNFNDESAARLEPYPMESFVPFEPSYLSGFYADASDEKEENLKGKINTRAGDIFNEAVLETVHGASSKWCYNRSYETSINRIRYGMLPVWYFAYQLEEKTYTIMVNGYTGKVVGAVPVDKVKVGIASALIGVPLSVVASYGCSLVLGVMKFDDGDGFLSLLRVLVVVFGLLYGTVFAKMRKFIKSRKLTMESSIYRLAKNRQGV